jgi:DNA-binding transcriptional ArsR family regulator
LRRCFITPNTFVFAIYAPSSKARAAVDELENLFKALADKTRLPILALLGNNEVCVCHIHDSLGLPQPTVSGQLAYLRKNSLVAARRDGVWMHYQLSRSLNSVIRGTHGRRRRDTAFPVARSGAPSFSRSRRHAAIRGRAS